jgi:hypothetical protein
MLYKNVTVLTNPLNLTATLLDALNINQNSLVLDIDTTAKTTATTPPVVVPAGAINIYLPSITSLMFGQGCTLNSLGVPINQTAVGAGAFSFYINGNRKAGSDAITLYAYSVSNSEEVDQDVICGAATAVVPVTVGSCFQAFITGRHSWCMLACSNVPPVV